MAFSKTVGPMYARTKDVTRRLDSWKNLKPDKVLVAIEKGQGLKRGESVVQIHEIKVVDVRLEPLEKILDEPHGATREGFPDLDNQGFIDMFCEMGTKRKPIRPDTEITRIEFKHRVDCDSFDCEKFGFFTPEQVQKMRLLFKCPDCMARTLDNIVYQVNRGIQWS